MSGDDLLRDIHNQVGYIIVNDEVGGTAGAALRDWYGKATAFLDAGRCIFPGCVSRDRHWHGGFPGGYTNPDDPDGPPIEFTAEPAPGVRDYNGAILAPDPEWDAMGEAEPPVLLRDTPEDRERLATALNIVTYGEPAGKPGPSALDEADAIIAALRADASASDRR